MHQRQHFEALAEDLRRHLAEGEDFTLWYSAEDSEFIRFNRARVRQAGRVRQANALLRLIRDERQASLDLTLSGAPEEDRQRLAEGLRQLRQSLAWIPADPYLLLDTSAWQRENQDLGAAPDSGALLASLERRARDLDLVGIYAAGPLFRGFANSWGAFGWHAGSSFNFDWSLFHGNGQAVKADYAGQRWDDEAFARRFEQAREQLGHLGKPLRQLRPGDYRAYLAPAALEEVMQMLCWGGFSARALATGESPLQRLQNGDALLSPLLNLAERPATSPSPAFSAEGSPRAEVELVGN
ncbi:TldD/PmbA family protein, partial [Pseudomonas aeruginosa]|nr:TldD/PmbA family protein [Pseudomonas aeruginosa]